jgi:hypothetical protein
MIGKGLHHIMFNACGIAIIYRLFENSGSGPITKRKVFQKRSIHVVCKHFEVLSNAVSGSQTVFSNRR